MTRAKLLLAFFALAAFAADPAAATMVGLSAEGCVGESCMPVDADRSSSERYDASAGGPRVRAEKVPVPLSLLLRRSGAGPLEITLSDIRANGKRPGGEACLAFSASAAALRHVRGEWTIVDGRHQVKGFGNKQRDAQYALDLIRQSRADQLCVAGRLSASLASARR